MSSLNYEKKTRSLVKALRQARGYTLADVAKSMGVTRERVRQMQEYPHHFVRILHYGLGYSEIEANAIHMILTKKYGANK